QPPAWDGHPHPTQEVATLRVYVQWQPYDGRRDVPNVAFSPGEPVVSVALHTAQQVNSSVMCGSHCQIFPNAFLGIGAGSGDRYRTLSEQQKAAPLSLSMCNNTPEPLGFAVEGASMCSRNIPQVPVLAVLVCLVVSS